MMALKIKGLSIGFSGVQPETLERLDIEMWIGSLHVLIDVRVSHTTSKSHISEEKAKTKKHQEKFNLVFVMLFVQETDSVAVFILFYFFSVLAGSKPYIPLNDFQFFVVCLENIHSIASIRPHFAFF